MPGKYFADENIGDCIVITGGQNEDNKGNINHFLFHNTDNFYIFQLSTKKWISFIAKNRFRNDKVGHSMYLDKKNQHLQLLYGLCTVFVIITSIFIS